MFATQHEVDSFLALLPYPYISPIVKRGKSAIADNGITAQRDIEQGEIIAINYGTVVDMETINDISMYYEYDNILCI